MAVQEACSGYQPCGTLFFGLAIINLERIAGPVILCIWPEVLHGPVIISVRQWINQRARLKINTACPPGVSREKTPVDTNALDRVITSPYLIVNRGVDVGVQDIRYCIPGQIGSMAGAEAFFKIIAEFMPKPEKVTLCQFDGSARTRCRAIWDKAPWVQYADVLLPGIF